MTQQSVDKPIKVFEFKNVKVIYIVDYQQFDCIVDLGCKLTINQRIAVKDQAQVAYKDYGAVKRLLSDLVLGQLVDIKTYNTKKFYGIYEAEIFLNGVYINDLLNAKILDLPKRD